MLEKNTLINKLVKKKWWVEEAPGVPFLFDYIMKTFVNAGNRVEVDATKGTIKMLNNNNKKNE